jgi:metal-dependent amidase/aminoacylase/carboxypeptidase family protein
MAGSSPHVAVSPGVSQMAESVIDLCRTLHQWPELGFQEQRTSALVAERLRALGGEVRTGVAHTGVLGILRGNREGMTVPLRADMDALTIEQASDAPYAS